MVEKANANWDRRAGVLATPSSGDQTEGHSTRGGPFDG
jgi:hypothetical protein